MTNCLDNIDRDNEGFLLDPQAWNEEIAVELARQDSIELTVHHWSVVRFIRQFYEDRQTVPEARALLSFLKQEISEEVATRRYVYQLFPYGYGQQACKIAGMRKPLKLMLDV